MKENNLFVEVIVTLPLENTLLYRVKEQDCHKIEIGKRVMVNVGASKLYCAIIKAVLKKVNVDFKLKTVQEVLDIKPIIRARQIEFWQWIAEYYMCSLGAVMQAALPSIFNLSTETYLSFNGLEEKNQFPMSPFDKLVCQHIKDHPNISLGKLKKHFNQNNVLACVKNLIDNKIIFPTLDTKEKYQTKKLKTIQLNSQYFKTKPLALKTIDKSPKQKQILDVFCLAKDPFKKVMTKSNLIKTIKSPSALDALIKKKLLVEKEIIESRLFNSQASKPLKLPPLSEHQGVAYDAINNAFNQQQCVLLQGVTSSGKTLIYKKLIADIIATHARAQILYLVPEIALTTQLVQRLKIYFPDQVLVYHSKLNAWEKAEVWQQVLKQKQIIVLGARSAIFLPFHTLKLIIVDEEHESSFKQVSPAPRYNGRDCAIYMGRLNGAKVLLGSATPSLESKKNALDKKYGWVGLNKRFGQSKLPKIEIISLGSTPIGVRQSDIFEAKLITMINQQIEKKGQSILFQNKRGTIPLSICKSCGYYEKCTYCDVSLTYHQSKNKMICHYCGFEKDKASICQKCHCSSWLEMGAGTEKIETEVNKLFHKAKAIRMDADSTRKKLSFQTIIDQIENQKVNVIIGTQMLAKGLDFHNVNLIGIICADAIWKFPDFRSQERAFQLLTQICGRAGRKKDNAWVYIQTYDIHYPILKMVKQGDSEQFFSQELEERKIFNYPPYSKLTILIIKNKDITKIEYQSSYLHKQICQQLENIALPVVKPWVSKVKTLHIRQIFLKLPLAYKQSKVIKKKLLAIKASFLKTQMGKGAKVYFDVDPN